MVGKDRQLCIATYFIKERFKGAFALLMILVLFLLNINVVHYTTHTIPLLGLARALSQGSFFLDPSYCRYVDTVLRGSKCVFVAPPGLPLIISPFLKVFSGSEPLIVGGFVVAISGFLAILSSWAFSGIIIGDKKKALFCVVAVALAGPLWVYSTHIFPQAPLAFTYTFFAYLAMKALRGELKKYEYVLAGFLASLTVLLDPAMITGIAASALIVLVKLIFDIKKGIEKLDRILMYIAFFLLGAAPQTIFLILYNIATAGSAVSSPEFLWLEKIGVPYPGFTTPIPLGLYILLVDFRKGLIPLYPVFAVAMACIPKVLKTMKSNYEKAMYLATLTMPLIIHSAWYDVDGGLSFGPRFIVPVTMLLAPSLAYVIESREKVIYVITSLLIFYGITVNAFTVTITPYPSTFEDLKPFQNQFISTVLPLLGKDTRSSYLYGILREIGEPLSTTTAITLNIILSITALITSYPKN